MAIVKEEKTFEEYPCTITVLEQEKGELTGPWRFIRIDIDESACMTPKEIRRLGHWLVKQSFRIGREYTSKGAKSYSKRRENEKTETR